MGKSANKMSASSFENVVTVVKDFGRSDGFFAIIKVLQIKKLLASYLTSGRFNAYSYSMVDSIDVQRGHPFLRKPPELDTKPMLSFPNWPKRPSLSHASLELQEPIIDTTGGKRRVIRMNPEGNIIDAVGRIEKEELMIVLLKRVESQVPLGRQGLLKQIAENICAPGSRVQFAQEVREFVDPTERELLAREVADRQAWDQITNNGTITHYNLREKDKLERKIYERELKPLAFPKVRGQKLSA